MSRSLIAAIGLALVCLAVGRFCSSGGRHRCQSGERGHPPIVGRGQAQHPGIGHTDAGGELLVQAGGVGAIVWRDPGALAGASYEFCAAAKGQKSPHTEDEFEKSATTKAAITKALDRRDRVLRRDLFGAHRQDRRRPGHRRVWQRQGGPCLGAPRQHRPLHGALRQPGHLLPHQGDGAAVVATKEIAARLFSLRELLDGGFRFVAERLRHRVEHLGLGGVPASEHRRHVGHPP